MTGRRMSFAKRTTSSPETKGKELKMSDSQNVARTFKAKGRGAKSQGEIWLEGGRVQEEEATRRDEQGKGGVGLVGSEGLSLLLPRCLRPQEGLSAWAGKKGFGGPQGRTACLHLERSQVALLHI